MTEKNVIGTYNRKDFYPEFGYESPEEEAIPAVDYTVPTLSRVAAIRGVTGNVSPIDQWRAFSERLRDRRLAKESLDSRLQQPKPGRALRPHPRPQPKQNREQQFQRTYEQDMVDINKNLDPMVLGLQRYLSLVNHPIPDEHLKAYETEYVDDEHPAATGEVVSETDTSILRVQEVMTRKVVCVIESTTIEQVASICNRRGFSGVPVLNDRQGLIGIVTLTDIINQLFNNRSISYYSEQGGKVLEQKALAVLDEPVRNYMHRDVITVPPECPVREACEIMMRHNIRRVVVTRGDIVRGIFSAQDAVKVLAAADLNIAD